MYEIKTLTGVYRAVVADNNDPTNQNRVKLFIQTNPTEKTDWVWALEPSSTHTKAPAIGQGVWVMFEGGDPAFPIWFGEFGKHQEASKKLFLKPLANSVSLNEINDVVIVNNQDDGTEELDVTDSLIAIAQKEVTLQNEINNIQNEINTLTNDVQGIIITGGIQGSQGPTGPQGPTGSQGIRGFQGLQGLQGTNGAQGQTGSQGVQGLQGNTGAGTQGIQGLQGIQGSLGIQGNLGPQGIQGIQGTQGHTGAQGYTGAQGFQGVQGTQGYTGSQGYQGIQGFQGFQGLQGVQGVQGVGVQGYTGSQGPIGAQGTRGLQGLQGVQGLQGIQGLQGSSEATQYADHVLYVSKSGNDSNDGTTLANAFLTIKAALAVAGPRTTVFVKSGDYYENNPVTIPAFVSVVGDSLRSVNIHASNRTSDLFYVNNGSYIKEVTFKDHLSPAAAIAYNPNGSAGNIYSSPYIYNCSSYTTTGTGMRIDGAVVSGGKSMVAGQFTQINLNGTGIHILNRGYAQLVSIYTICCNYGILCESGGFCSLIGSDSSFGNYGLVAKGVSELLYTGVTPAIAKNDSVVTITGLSQTPFVNNVVTFDDGITYYTIGAVTPVSSGNSTITLIERVASNLSSGLTAKFFQASKITASGHTFEYCGSGTDLVSALPQSGGIPIQANEVVQENGGQVYYTSTDQRGDFRIGSDLTINRGTGTITGITFDKSLFAVMTPYILAIEG